MHRGLHSYGAASWPGRWIGLSALAALLVFGGCGPEEGDESADAASDDARHSAARHDASRATPSGAPNPTSGAEAAPTEPVEPKSCLTGNCHQDRLRRAYRHRPVEVVACDACHLPEQPVHKFPLRQTGPGLCTSCHRDMENGPHLHAVVGQEGCLPCHDPHGSNAQYLLAEMSVELTCQGCHHVDRKPQRHDLFASGACTACHDPHQGDNPSLLLGGEGPDHCLICHLDRKQADLDARFVHKPMLEESRGEVPRGCVEPMQGGCQDCHTHHSSDYDNVLVGPIYEVCIGCHPAIEDLMSLRQSPHGAVFTGRSCVNCHDAHSGDRGFLLRDDELPLCLNCHEHDQETQEGRTIPSMRQALLNSRYLHGPIRAGECSACHQTHASRYTMLLRLFFPPEFYETFRLSNYALCFTCHSERAVLFGPSSTFTDFRDGETNLHYAHVNRLEKGRSCRTCHELHGSNLPNHMASTVPFEGGGWSMPIGFQRTGDGGRCSPGCHGPEEYRRVARRTVDEAGQSTSPEDAEE